MSRLIRWVMPNESEVNKFKDLYEEKFGVELNADEALDLAIRYIHIFQYMTWEDDTETTLGESQEQPRQD